jgi:hypothetical protein
MEPSTWGHNWITLILGIQIRERGPPGWRSLDSETVKCGNEFRGTRTRESLLWRGPAAIVINDTLILSIERMLHGILTASVELKKILVVGLKGLGTNRLILRHVVPRMAER